jgi:hypothetical protein
MEAPRELRNKCIRKRWFFPPGSLCSIEVTDSRPPPRLFLPQSCILTKRKDHYMSCACHPGYSANWHRYSLPDSGPTSTYVWPEVAAGRIKLRCHLSLRPNDVSDPNIPFPSSLVYDNRMVELPLCFCPHVLSAYQ